MNTSAHAAAAFKQRDAGSYDTVSDSFAHFTTRFSQPIAVRMAELAALSTFTRALDVGTGTGIVALAAASRLGANGHVNAIDLSAGMLATAERLASNDPAGVRITFQSMDAEALEFGDNTFDVVLSLFALLHFPNPLAALREMQRVLKPGHALVLALGSGPSMTTLTGWMHAVQMLPTLVRRRLGRELAAPAFLDAMVEKYLPRSHADEQSALAGHGHRRLDPAQELARQAGFCDISTDWVGYNHQIATPEEFWELQRTFSSLARKRINEAPQSKVDEMQEAFMNTCQRVLAGGGKLVYPVGVVILRARKPGSK
jgi:ubiquinone/menaquinone biosynthesis C-methylase UbiE